jgi:sulfotransferase family protein
MNPAARRPVLVTGMHRSGTTWLGQMLCTGGDFINVGEPLNILYRQTILRRRAKHWYTYITQANEDDYLPYYRDAVSFKTHPIDDIKRARLTSPRDPIRLPTRWMSFLLGRVQDRRLLIKDPFAVFSIEWFVERLDFQVMVIVRHPVAVVSSLKRLGFTFDFNDLLRQPLLMADHLDPFRSEIEAMAARPDDVIGQGALLWKIIYSNIDTIRRSGLFQLVRHEDLSRNPVEEFASLFENVGQPFTEAARREIEQATGDQNPSEVSRRRPFTAARFVPRLATVRLDSRTNLENWRHRLSSAEVERILDIAGPVADRFYPDWRARGSRD